MNHWGGAGQKEPNAAGKAQRKVVGEFKARLARMVERNEILPELEKMDRSEFVVDLAGRYAPRDRRRILSLSLLRPL